MKKLTAENASRRSQRTQRTGPGTLDDKTEYRKKGRGEASVAQCPQRYGGCDLKDGFMNVVGI